MRELLPAIGTVAANNQPSAEGQHGHRATQLPKISGVVDLEAEGLFKRIENQSHSNHIGEMLCQALEAVH